MSATSSAAGKKILVLGATGRCGKAVVERALELKMQVRIYVRNVEKAKEMYAATDAVEVIKGELDDPERIRMALQGGGVDGVISTIASYNPPHTQMSTAMKSLAEAAAAAAATSKDDGGRQDHPLRVIHYGLCGFENPKSDFLHRQSLASLVSPWKFGPAIQDHRRTIETLSTSSGVLKSTIFMTPLIVYSKPLGQFIAGSNQDVPTAQIWNRIGATDAADACLQRIINSDDNDDDNKKNKDGLDFLYVKCK